MFNKKIYLYILMLFLVSICAISTVSASENVSDTTAIDDAISEDVVTSFDEDLSAEVEDNAVSAQEDNNDVESQDVLAGQQDDVLSATPISYLNYKIDLNDNGYEISAKDGGTIYYYMEPCQTYALNAYNFYFALIQIDENGDLVPVFKSQTFSSSAGRTVGNYNYKFAANSVAPGLYLLAAYNDGLDTNLMDSTVLKAKGNAVISASDYNADYNSGQSTTVKVTDKNTGKPLKFFEVKAVFNDGTESVSKYFITDSAGQFSYVPPFNVGTCTVTYSSNLAQVSAAAVKRTMVINKAQTTTTASKVSAYQGYKVTLKATVKSQGKNVNEGTVTFKINGKTYNAAVKNGVATKKVKLSKVKSYKYTATFKGNNFVKSAASSTATIKKRSATKIYVKNQVCYRDSPKKFYVTVKTTSGKLVKSGKVKIIDAVKVNKKGKAKFYTGTDLNYIKQVGNTVYFKKTVSKTFKVKYIPASKAYKPSTAKVKITMKYRCSACGSTTSHSHPAMNMRFIVS
ncbi:Ig-like domain-containing protein [Methanobrevibacter sp.]|uniref:Ig-like domain-containing protein n=1 Tax=Methanobrevibacter sp. TaxID=66852 RepID=UPI00386BC0EE